MIQEIARSDFHSRVSEDVTLKIIKYESENTDLLPVVIFPGWITLLERYYSIIEGLVISGHPVYYVETREKASSRFVIRHSYADFSFDRYVKDIRQLIINLGFDKSGYYTLSGSFGAGLVTKYLAASVDPSLHPIRSVMIIPATGLHFRGWQKLLIRTPLIFEQLIITVVEWYIKRSFHNPAEPEEGYRFSSQIYEFDFAKIKHSAIAIDKAGGMKLKEDLKSIDGDVLVVGAENDFMHPEKETKLFARMLKKAKYVNVISNHWTHSNLMGRIAAQYFANKPFDSLMDQITLK